jgi:hypothetical protein
MEWMIINHVFLGMSSSLSSQAMGTRMAMFLTPATSFRYKNGNALGTI